MPSRVFGGRGAAVLALLAVVTALGVRLLRGPTGDEPHVLSGPTMGSLYHVTIDQDLTEAELARVRSVIEERLGHIERLFSTYDTASEVSRFNRHASVEPFAVSGEMLEVLAVSRDVSERSDGALDVTVGPLVDAWGFGPADRDGAIPDDTTLAELLALVGYERIVIDEAAGTIAKLDPAVRIDLSAVGQGYAVDAVAAALAGLGLTNFLVELSGELRASSTRRDGTPWRVGIEAPAAGIADLWGTIELVDEGISTSGDYLNYLEIDGVRYSHLVDPRTGRLVRMLGASVTVVHASAAVADAWDTALAVLGPDAGYALAEREGLAALFLTRRDDEFEARVTSALGGRVRRLSDG
jgi:thiamine biosynthesis lipoprotein